MPTRGDIIVANSVPAWSALAKGTQNKILSMGADDPGWIDAPTLASLISTQVRNSMASVYLSVDTPNIADASWTKVPLDSETFDIGGNFDTTNKRYVAPVTGYYQVSWCVGFACQSARVFDIISSLLYVNGAAHSQGSQTRWASYYPANGMSSGSALALVTAGQYIELYGYISTTDNSANGVFSSASGRVSTRMDINLLTT
jgi:hypothetical protein